MIWSSRRTQLRLAADDRGIAMVVVMSMVLVISVLVTTIFTLVLNEQRGVVRDRDITTAREAAEAGIDEVVFKLGQDTSGVPNWNSYPTTYGADSSPYSGSVGGGSFRGTVKVDPTDSTRLIVTMRGQYPTGSGQTRTLQATVVRQSPPAFDYSMFASTKIQVHNHGGWLSPDVVTTKVHSNGDITLDGPSQYKVESMTAVNSITFQDGFTAKLPNGTAVPTSGYNWTDTRPTPQLCFPGRTDGACTDASPKYKGHASITGDVAAKTVTIGNRGQTLPGTAETTVTGQLIPATGGNVKASTANINGSGFTTTASGTACPSTKCNLGTAAGGGQIGGGLTIQPGFAPAVIPFPALNYRATYKVRAQSQPGTRVFASPTAFLDYVTNASNGFYRKVDPTTGALTPWQSGDPAPGALLLDGDWYITSGKLDLNWANMLLRAKNATGTNPAQPPVIVVRGSLVNETGEFDIATPFAMVGAGNRVDFLKPGPVIDVTKLIDPAATEPGVLAAGGGIHGDDCDKDDEGQAYEPLKTCPIYVRGLAYSAAYNTTTKLPEPSDQHWHNEDSKNLVRIFGAQVGNKLHDCSTFSFTYDPLVRKAFGFSGSGAVAVQDFRELGA